MLDCRTRFVARFRIREHAELRDVEAFEFDLLAHPHRIDRVHQLEHDERQAEGLAELAPAEPTSDRSMEEVAMPQSPILVETLLELILGEGCAEPHFPSARPPSVVRIILLRQFRN